MRNLISSILVSALATSAHAQQTPSTQDPPRQKATSVNVEMKDSKGQSVGTVEIRALGQGLLLVADLKGLPPGAHGFHLHEKGVCDGPDFKSAGGHFNPTDAEHGFDNEDGPHLGDLPNIHVSEQGTARAEFFAIGLTLGRQFADQAGGAATGAGEGGPGQAAAMTQQDSLLDADGTAIIVHEKADDYRNQDSAGDRIACGVVRAP